MPTVPSNVVALNAPQAQRPVPDTFLAMAASDLHEAGRLFEPEPQPLEKLLRDNGEVHINESTEAWPHPADQKFLKNLPDDVERIPKGDNVILRIRKKATEDLVS